MILKLVVNVGAFCAVEAVRLRALNAAIADDNQEGGQPVSHHQIEETVSGANEKGTEEFGAGENGAGHQEIEAETAAATVPSGDELNTPPDEDETDTSARVGQTLRLAGTGEEIKVLHVEEVNGMEFEAESDGTGDSQERLRGVSLDGPPDQGRGSIAVSPAVAQYFLSNSVQQQGASDTPRGAQNRPPSPKYLSATPPGGFTVPVGNGNSRGGDGSSQFLVGVEGGAQIFDPFAGEKQDLGQFGQYNAGKYRGKVGEHDLSQPLNSGDGLTYDDEYEMVTVAPRSGCFSRFLACCGGCKCNLFGRANKRRGKLDAYMLDGQEGKDYTEI